MARELPWWRPLIDPQAAAYIYILFFEPLYVPLHAPDLLLAPVFGASATQIVALSAIAGCAALVAHMAARASRSNIVGFALMALFLFNTGTWYALADSAYRHYPVATAFALLSALAPWRYLVDGRAPTTRDAWLSAGAYWLALCAKESVAATPAFLVVLLLAAGQRVGATIRFVIPHALALAVFMGWRTYIIGGLGGYPTEQRVLIANLVVDVIRSAEAVWGAWWPLLPLALAVAVLRPKAVLLGLAAWLAAFAPFTLTFPLDASGGGVGKCLLGIALFLLVVAFALAPALGRGRRTAAIAGGGLVVLGLLIAQVRHLPAAESLPFTTPPHPERPRADVAITDGLTLLDVFWERQFQRATEPLLVLVSPDDWRLYQRVVEPGSSPADPAAGPPVRIRPLAPERFSVAFDGRAIRFCVLDGSSRVRVAGMYQNGSTRFFVSSPLADRCLTGLPSYSIRWFYVIFQDSDDEWAVSRHDVPTFVDPYPPVR
jgi:hypothetical protein